MRLKPLAVSILVLFALVASTASAADPAWHTAFDATEGSPAQGLSCGTVSLCMVVGNTVAVEDDGPIYETVVDMYEPTAVSCAPGSHFCMLMDGNGGSVEFSGDEFGDVDHFAGDHEFLSVSCAAVDRCVAITHSFTPAGGGAERFLIYKFDDDGWDGGTELNASGITGSSQPRLACATATSCLLVANTGGEHYWTWSGGSAWTPGASAIASRGAGDYTVSLTCTATNFCLSTSHDGEASVYTGGSSWTTTTVDSHGLKQLASSCSAKTCRAITFGGYAYNTTNGTTWTPNNPANIHASTNFNGASFLSCPSADTCVASDGSGDAITYGRDIVPQKPPVISGVGAVGETLTISTHSLIDNPNAWFFPEWWRCTYPGSACSQIPDEHDATYVVSDDDVGKYIDVLEGAGIGLDEELFKDRSNNIAVPGPASPPSGTTPDTGGSPSDGSPGTGPGATHSAISAPRLGKPATSKKGVVTLTLTCPAGGARCTGKLRLTFKSGKKHKTAGSAHYSVAAGKKGKAKVKLKGAARKLLRSRHKLAVVLTVTPAGAKAKTHKVTLKLPRKH